MPWWVFVLILLMFACLTFTAGMAVPSAIGPSVEVGPLIELDVPNKVFFVLLRNGPIPAKASLRITQVTDSFGTRHIEHSWEGHWRGRPPNFVGDLVEHDLAQYGLLGVAQFPSGNPTLVIYSKDPAGRQATSEHTFISISRDVPLEQQGTSSLEVVATCVTATGARGRAQESADTSGKRVVGGSRGFSLAEMAYCMHQMALAAPLTLTKD